MNRNLEIMELKYENSIKDMKNINLEKESQLLKCKEQYERTISNVFININ